MSLYDDFCYRWKNFSPEEVLSLEGLEMLEQGHLMISGYMMDRLQGFRTFLGRSIYVNFGSHRLRGYRSPAENQTIKGHTDFSRHVQGLAVDLTIKGFSVDEMHNAAKAWGFSAVGKYPDRGFVHCDIRTHFGNNPISWTING